MRKFVRNQILDLLTTIWEGIKQAKTLETRTAESVLTDCYLAVQTLEQILQNGLSHDSFTKYVYSLSTVKELLEETNAGIAQGVSVAEVTKRLKTELKRLRKILLEEKEIKLEVAFFPYKASMWDSLESIWIAARDDENCDAYVVPIPYYDKLPNGEFGTMHCEADLYPDYVPVVSWQAYDVEERHPDIIFIHNPYDNNNFVTSVHPDFYSERLRKCTEMLVYVPYFVVSGDISEHLCVTPGCVYAHKTIVQSESVCTTYIRVFEATFGNQFGNPRGKFVALGSPKFDKVISAKREDYNMLPERLDNLLEGKKVVLYNTSIGAMLQDSKQYLTKLKNVLNAFRDQKDAVLWWRPHPLLESTLNSMRPLLAGEYRKIVKGFQQEAYKILDGKQDLELNFVRETPFVYDDSQDLHRAIALSDMLISDPSSVVALYKATGKPLLMQSPQFEQGKINMPFQNIIVSPDALWVSGWASNVICRIDKKKLNIDYKAVFSGYAYNAFELYHCGAFIGDDKILFAPFFANDIAIFNIKTNDIQKLDVFEECDKNERPAFTKSIRWKNFVYFIPYNFKALVRFDVDIEQFKYFPYLTSPGKREIKIDDCAPFYDACLCNDEMLMVSISTNVVISVNCISNHYNKFVITPCKEGISTVCFDGRSIWLGSKSGKIFCCSPSGENIREVAVNFDIHHNRNLNLPAYESIEYYNGFVWVIPHNSRIMFKIDIATFSVCKLLETEKAVINDNALFGFMSVKIDGNILYMVSNNRIDLIIYNMDTHISHTVKLYISESTAGSWEIEVLKQHENLLSENFVRLETFTNYVVKNVDCEANQIAEKCDSLAGKAICDYCIKIVGPN